MASLRGSYFTPALIGLVVLCATRDAIGVNPGTNSAPKLTGVAASVGDSREATIRMGSRGSIVRVHHGSSASAVTAGATPPYPFPRPRLAGFSPLIAITTSSKHSPDDIDYEHDLESNYDCNPLVGPIGGFCGALNPPANRNFVVGYLDSGSVADLAAGSGAELLGLTCPNDFCPDDPCPNMTCNSAPIGGVGEPVDAYVTQPIGIYAAGLSAVDSGGILDMDALVGHSNVVALAAPPIICEGTEQVSAFVGTPFLAFYTSVIRVDTPRSVTVRGQTFSSPDVQIQGIFDPIPEFAHEFEMVLGSGGIPALTASYYPDTDLAPEDPGYLITPAIPTALSLVPLAPPTGGLFFREVQAVEGEPSPTNLPITMNLVVDMGAQVSIISRGMRNNLNLSLEPDFTVDACGVGGLIEDIPGYYIDYVKINAGGGALEFSRVPFVMIDLPTSQLGQLDGVLGMNFFWNRNVAFEPSLTFSSIFYVSDPIPVAFADSNVDFHVDAADATFFLTCITGPQSAGVNPECDHLDVDFDGSIDLRDMAKFQNCYSGSQQLANPNCGQ